ncbi:SDR family NAD(P)-dependent oxidoreductase [Brachybacterium vulturis]|uniref:SDR family NAD(P)-dependent oxidoreductase n=1 Tax=Brachybacterium vulturis TaxID=2017484 RepID=UPI0037364090
MTEYLSGAVAIVTGSVSGIGASVARALHAEGARVVLNSRSSVAAGRRMEAGLRDSVYQQADVTQREGAQALVQCALDQWGRVDILINCAGATQRIDHADLESATDEVWEQMLSGNVLSIWHMVQECVPAMLNEGLGRIVNISSMAGLEVMGSSIPYAAMKAAVNHTTRLLAKSLGPEITVNAIAPGLIDTPWTAGWTLERDQVRTHSPMRRIGTPEDVAEACISLLSQAYTTGVVLPVDGGTRL